MPRDEPRLGRREFASAAGLFLAGGAATRTTAGTPSGEPTPKWTSDVGAGGRIRLADVHGDLALVETGDALVALSVEDGSERWRFDGGTDPPTLVGAAGGRIYANTGGTLYAVDAADGRERWYAGTGRVGIAAAEGTVFIGTGEGVTAYAVEDGSPRWHADGIDAPDLRLHDGTLYAAGRGTLYALAAGDGSRRWAFAADDDGTLTFDGGYQQVGPGLAWTTGTVADDTVLVQRAGGDLLYAVSAGDGSERWRVDDEQVLQYGVRDGAVYAAGEAAVRSLAAADGAERWRTSPGTEMGGGRLSLAGGHLLVQGADALHRLSFETGETEWSEALDGSVLSEVTGDVIAVGSANGPHAALSPADGSRFWRYEPPERVTWYPQVADGTVFMGTEAGRVHAVDVPVADSLLATVAERVGPLPLAFGGTLVGGALLAGGYRLLHTSDRTEPAPEPVPAEVDAFEVGRDLGGRGGRTVHVASWPGGGDRRVALKRFPADADADRFREAMATWTALHGHPGVLPVREWGTEPTPWLATAYAERGSLEGALGTLPTDAGLEAVADAAEAVHAAHREGAVHGNLHAGNVFLVDGEPAAAVGDWGFAGTRPADAPHVAPERRGENAGREPDARADVFSLGALAYRAATGRDPYPDGAGDAPTPPSEVDPALDPALDEPILRALAVDPGERQATALAFRDALRWAAFVR